MQEFINNLLEHHKEATISTLIGLVATIFFSALFYYIAKRDGDNTLKNIKKLHDSDQQKLQLLEKKLEAGEIQAKAHDKLTAEVNTNISGVIQYLYCTNDQNLSASDTLIKVKALLKQQKINEAELVYQAKKDALKGTVHLHYIDSLIHFEKENTEEALALLEVITESFTGDVFIDMHEIYALKGSIYLELYDNYYLARENYIKANQAFDNDEYIIKVASCDCSLGELTLAKLRLEHCQDKTSNEYLSQLAKIYINEANYLKADHYNNQILDKFPHNPDGLLNRVISAEKQHKYSDVIRAGYFAIKHCQPKGIELKYALELTAKSLLLIENNPYAAEDLYIQYHRSFPKSKKILNMYFFTLMTLKKDKMIMALGERLQILNHSHICYDAINTLGIIYLRYNHFEKAYECFKSILAFSPHNIGYLLNLTLVFIYSADDHRKDEALHYCELIASLPAADVPLLINAAYLSIFHHEYTQAHKFISKARKLKPTDSSVQNTSNLYAHQYSTFKFQGKEVARAEWFKRVKKSNETDMTLYLDSYVPPGVNPIG